MVFDNIEATFEFDPCTNYLKDEIFWSKPTATMKSYNEEIFRELFH